jgi:NAD(P)-dependent dehydrogenase (short-subunit alcohol dehydrogenase family)
VTNFHRSSGYTEAQYAAVSILAQFNLFLKYSFIKYLEACKKSYALGRVGDVNEVSNTIAFLASDAASFITGELIHVAGGKQVMCPR